MFPKLLAGVVELIDAPDSKSGARDGAEGKESYVTVTKSKADFRNEGDWDSQFTWLAERLEKLDNVVRKRVTKVDIE